MLEVNVKSLVYYEHQPNEYVIEHTHNCYECVLYINGKGTVTADNDVYEYEGATLTIVSPDIKHEEKTQEFTRLYFTLFQTNAILIKKYQTLKLSKELTDFYLDLFDKMQNEERDKKPFFREIIDSYFSIALSVFLRETGEADGHSFDKNFVERIKNYIKENYNQNIDFSRIAMSAGYSFDRMRHIFQKEAKVSLYRYLLNCRLYAAKQMLISTDKSVKEIALSCGFSSSVHFNNFFKERMQLTPLEFRNASRKEIDVGVFKL